MHQRLNAAHHELIELDKGFSDERPAAPAPGTFWGECRAIAQGVGSAALIFFLCFALPALFGGA